MLEEAKQAEPITQPKSKVWYEHLKLSKDRSPSIFSDVHNNFCIYILYTIIRYSRSKKKMKMVRHNKSKLLVWNIKCALEREKRSLRVN